MAWETLPHSYTSPQNHLWIFKTLWVIIFWVTVTCKMLNLNYEKIHSIILSVTCHGLRNFPSLIHIPSYPFLNFQNPMSYYFFELESLIKCWMWIGKKIHLIILSITCHGLRNFPLSHTHPLISICKFSKTLRVGWGWGHMWVWWGWSESYRGGVGVGSCSKTT